MVTLPAWRRARSVALYWPADGEIDVRELAMHAWSRGKRVYLPVVGHGGTMRFAPWTRAGRLSPNRYGIPEPVGGRPRIDFKSLDLVVMPLVAFDARGTRLGMGGGYYDRALAQSRRRPLLIGASYSFQESPAIPAQPWDIPVELIITERGLRHVRCGRGVGRPSATGAEQCSTG
jgi:5-formyltetrahydrofolate cyclo-ligase